MGVLSIDEAAADMAKQRLLAGRAALAAGRRSSSLSIAASPALESSIASAAHVLGDVVDAVAEAMTLAALELECAVSDVRRADR